MLQSIDSQFETASIIIVYSLSKKLLLNLLYFNLLSLTKLTFLTHLHFEQKLISKTMMGERRVLIRISFVLIRPTMLHIGIKLEDSKTTGAALNSLIILGPSFPR